MITIKTIALASSFLFLGNLFAQDRTPLEASAPEVQALIEHSKSTKSLRADFIQEKHLKLLATPIISNGIIRFQRPGKLRWEVTTPDASVAVVNGKSMQLSKAGKLETVTATDRQAFGAISDMIEGIVSGTVLSGESMKALYFKTKNGLLVELEPNDPRVAKRLSQMQLVFDLTTHNLQQLRMQQPNGDYTLINFSNAEIGAKHPANTFILP